MYVKNINFILQIDYILLPLYGHHQAYHLNHVIKTLRTLLGSQLCLQNLK